MQVSQAIQQLGYTKNEVKVYLATLAMGECTVSEVALKVKMPRSTAQTALDQLHKDGLINFYVRKRYKYWVAEIPEKLIAMVKEKEETLVSSLKNLILHQRGKNGKPTVKVFTGADEIRLIHNIMVAAKHHISAIIPWESWTALLGREYLNDFIALRVRHFLTIRVLTPETLETRKLKNNDKKELRQIAFLPSHVKIEDALFIFGDSVAIISLNESQPTGVIIDDPATARMMKIFFEDFWRQGNAYNEMILSRRK